MIALMLVMIAVLLAMGFTSQSSLESFLENRTAGTMGNDTQFVSLATPV